MKISMLASAWDAAEGGNWGRGRGRAVRHLVEVLHICYLHVVAALRHLLGEREQARVDGRELRIQRLAPTQGSGRLQHEEQLKFAVAAAGHHLLMHSRRAMTHQ